MEAFWNWPRVVFTVGMEHLSDGRVVAQRDQSCNELVMFTSSKHQQRGEMSEIISGWVMIAGMLRTVKARCPVVCGC